MSDSVTTWAECLKLTTTGGTVIGMTTHDADITFDGVTYGKARPYTNATLSSDSSLSVNNTDFESPLVLTGLSKADINGGVYDFASLEFFLIDYETNTKVRDLLKGKIGEIELTEGWYKAEFRSLSQYLQQSIGGIFTNECPASVGDDRCGVNLVPFTYTGAVTSVTSNQKFIDSSLIGTQSDDYYRYGLITFTSGDNNTYKREVKSYDDSTGELVTFLPFPFAIAATDTFTVYAGCDKSPLTCQNRFSNIANYRGFPFIRGRDFLLKGAR